MIKTKRYTKFAAILAIIAMFLVACSSNGNNENNAEVNNVANNEEVVEVEYRLGVSMPAATHGWMAAAVSYTQNALAQYEEFETTVLTSADAAKQIEDIRELVELEVDAILIAPHDDSVTTAVEEAYEAGLKVVVFDRNLPTDKYTAYISGDNKALGTIDAEKLVEYYEETKGEAVGKVLELKGVDAQITDIRRSGFYEIVDEYEGIEVIDGGFTDYLRDKGYELTLKAIQDGVEFDAIYSHDDEISIGAIRAIREMKLEDEIVIVASGGMKEIYQMMRGGEKPETIVSATYSPRMGISAVDFVTKLVKGEALEGDWTKTGDKTYAIHSHAVTKDNVDEYYDPNALY